MAQKHFNGSTGLEVRDLQLALNARPPSMLPPLNPDGLFGDKTAARVKEFQGYNGLVSDGVVGVMTREALAGCLSKSIRRRCECCNGESSASIQAASLTTLFARTQSTNFNLVSSPGGNTSAGSSAVRIVQLDATQQAAATNVYGASLDFSRVFISTALGAGDRPFTFGTPRTKDGTGMIQVMNCGTTSPSNGTLIHELAHVWQSQHHSDPTRFMVNSVASQALAIESNLLEVRRDPMIIINRDHPKFYPFDSYAYDPRTPFTGLAAEQMARAIENGESAIIAHVRGIAMNAVDPDCETALNTSRFADHRIPGIKG